MQRCILPQLASYIECGLTPGPVHVCTIKLALHNLQISLGNTPNYIATSNVTSSVLTFLWGIKLHKANHGFPVVKWDSYVEMCIREYTIPSWSKMWVPYWHESEILRCIYIYFWGAKFRGLHRLRISCKSSALEILLASCMWSLKLIWKLAPRK